MLVAAVRQCQINNGLYKDGKFTDSQIEWTYSLDDTDGVYISGELIQLKESTMELIKKLYGYYATWSEDWNKKINTDYEPENV